MVNKDEILKLYQGEAFDSIQNAFETLVGIGFFQNLVKLNQYRLVQSFESQDDAILAQQIKEMRLENKVFLTLDSLFNPPQ